jgi:hypothetical protein
MTMPPTAHGASHLGGGGGVTGRVGAVNVTALER